MTQAGLGPAQVRARRRLAWLVGTRLVLALALLAVSSGLPLAGRSGTPEAAHGLHSTLVLACLVSALSGARLRWVRSLRRFAAAQVALDLATVGALVHFTGGADSVFASLYVPVVAYAALFFERRGALLAACLAALSFGAVLAVPALGWVRGFGPVMAAPILASVWGVQGGALLVVALLASFLSRELHLTGEALARSRHDLHRLRWLHARTVESLLSGLVTTDPDGRITSLNPEARRISGIRTEDVLGRHVEEMLPGAGALLRPGEGVPRARMSYQNRRGDALHLGLAASVLREVDGSPAGHVVIFQDVTSVVEMEQQLLRSERLAAVGQLAAAIAHEVRNPLAAISGSIQILAGGLVEQSRNEEPGRLMEIVLRETERLNRLITDFLQYARPAPTRGEAVCLAGVVAETAEMLAKGEGKGLEIEIDVPSHLAVWADRGQLQQLLWNLLLNAAQAMPGGGGLRVSATPRARAGTQGEQGPVRTVQEGEADPGVEISVVDTGVGIAPDVLDHIFDPFFTTKRAGSGLGLATVHGIVERNRGQLRVESAPGSGTTFCVWLPCAKSPA
ncbi:MAG: PAS domain S-box protein [Deltaproteobacteria bacterium]|nr:PAS domain S-box protein [Deltaproteobacteria bacterium]